MAVILPPKVYHYEPKIFGFKIHGKRGSKAFNPPKGNVRYIEDSMQSLELQELKKKEGLEDSIEMDFSKQLSLDKGGSNDNTEATGEDNDARLIPDANRNKKNRKKNKKWVMLVVDANAFLTLIYHHAYSFNLSINSILCSHFTDRKEALGRAWAAERRHTWSALVLC